MNPALEFLGDKASEVWANSPGKAQLGERFKGVAEIAKSATRARRFFHWQLEFPEVFLANGGSGFDAVVGNPPYVRSEALSDSDKTHLKSRYRSVIDRCDIYLGFIEKCTQMLSIGGTASLIVSGQFATADYGREVRGLLEPVLVGIVDLEPLQIFEDATTYPTILVFGRRSATTSISTAMSVLAEHPELAKAHEAVFERATSKLFTHDEPASPSLWTRLKSAAGTNLGCFDQWSATIGDICNVSSTLKSGRDSVLVGKIQTLIGGTFVLSLQSCEIEVSAALWRPLLRPSDLGRWDVGSPQDAIFFPYQTIGSEYVILPERRIRELCPQTYAYLVANKRELLERRDSGKSWEEHGRVWYSLHRVGKPADHEPPRLLSPGEFNVVRFVKSKSNDLWPCARIIGVSQSRVTIEALQLFLSSREVDAYFRTKLPAKRGGYRGMAVGDLASLPCPKVGDPIWAKLVDTVRENGIPPRDEENLRDAISALVSG